MCFGANAGPNFTLVEKLLYDIMAPSDTFRWGTVQEKAFDELRQKLMESQSLHIQIQKIYLYWIQMP